MQASSTDMFTKGAPTLMTMSLRVARMSALVASTSMASSACACNWPGCCRLPLSCTDSMMAWHLPSVREAMWMSPSSSLFCAHLCATTWPTPPAPMIRTLCFIEPLLLIRLCRPDSGQAADVVGTGKVAHQAHAAVHFTDGDGRHVHAVEPVLLDHGVAAGVPDGDAVADLQRAFETCLAEDVAGQAGLAADL